MNRACVCCTVVKCFPLIRTSGWSIPLEIVATSKPVLWLELAHGDGYCYRIEESFLQLQFKPSKCEQHLYPECLIDLWHRILLTFRSCGFMQLVTATVAVGLDRYSPRVFQNHTCFIGSIFILNPRRLRNFSSFLSSYERVVFFPLHLVHGSKST